MNLLNGVDFNLKYNLYQILQTSIHFFRKN